VESREPTSLVRVVIRGARTAATSDEPTSPAMPSFGWQLSDEQIASVTTYIRNSWGHAASPTSLDDVRKARQALKARS
jgi:mono/diheme cytochrome c family protein